MVIYDAVVRSKTYSSPVTNKEETFLYIRLDASATDVTGSSVMPFYYGVRYRSDTVSTVSAPLVTLANRVTKGIIIDSGRLELIKQ